MSVVSSKSQTDKQDPNKKSVAKLNDQDILLRHDLNVPDRDGGLLH